MKKIEIYSFGNISGKIEKWIRIPMGNCCIKKKMFNETIKREKSISPCLVKVVSLIAL